MKSFLAVLLFFMFSFSSIIHTSNYQIEALKKLQLNTDELTKICNFIAGEEEGCTWVAEYPLIADLINEMNLKKGCEIGVAYGGQSQYLLEQTHIETLYSIDPYKHFTKNEYPDFLNFEQKVHDVLFLKVMEKLEIFGNRSILLRETSQDAVKRFDDNSLDFVYIDANHTYEYVRDDLNRWSCKVRPGGLIAGDDYINWPGVSKAVREFTQAHRISFNVQGNKWWFIKP